MALSRAIIRRDRTMASQQAPTNTTNTLAEFMAKTVCGDPSSPVWVKFKNPVTGERPFRQMVGNYSHGHYELTPEQLLAGEDLAEQIIKIAAKLGVDIREFADVREVMSFDTNPRELSRRELGAYLIGQALANQTSLGAQGFQSKLSPVFRMASSKLSIELGRQVYGDNFPEHSATNTLTEASMDSVKQQL